MTRACRGFTLIEMLGVLAIMALLSGFASLMLTGAKHHADLQDAVGELASADSFSRTLARRFDAPIKLTISLTSGQLTRTSGAGSTTLATLPSDIKIEQVRPSANTVNFGSSDISYSSRGCSSSYAVCLAEANGEKQWILFCGLSGQLLNVKDEDVEPILQLATDPTGNDAH